MQLQKSQTGTPQKAIKRKKLQKWVNLAFSSRGSFSKIKSKLATFQEKNKQKANLSPYQNYLKGQFGIQRL